MVVCIWRQNAQSAYYAPAAPTNFPNKSFSFSVSEDSKPKSGQNVHFSADYAQTQLIKRPRTWPQRKLPLTMWSVSGQLISAGYLSLWFAILIGTNANPKPPSCRTFLRSLPVVNEHWWWGWFLTHIYQPKKERKPTLSSLHPAAAWQQDFPRNLGTTKVRNDFIIM